MNDKKKIVTKTLAATKTEWSTSCLDAPLNLFMLDASTPNPHMFCSRILKQFRLPYSLSNVHYSSIVFNSMECMPKCKSWVQKSRQKRMKQSKYTATHTHIIIMFTVYTTIAFSIFLHKWIFYASKLSNYLSHSLSLFFVCHLRLLLSWMFDLKIELQWKILKWFLSPCLFLFSIKSCFFIFLSAMVKIERKKNA